MSSSSRRRFVVLDLLSDRYLRIDSRTGTDVWVTDASRASTFIERHHATGAMCRRFSPSLRMKVEMIHVGSRGKGTQPSVWDQLEEQRAAAVEDHYGS